MGLFGDILGSVGKGVAYSAGLMNSSETTVHEYTSYVDHDIRADQEYRKLLEEALSSIVQERDMDDYLADIALRRYTLSRFAVRYAHYPESGGSSVVWKLFFDPSPTLNDPIKVVCIKLKTPNARQLGYDGRRLGTTQDKYEFTYGSNRGRTEVSGNPSKATKKTAGTPKRAAGTTKKTAARKSSPADDRVVHGVIIGDSYKNYVSASARVCDDMRGMKRTRASLDLPKELSYTNILFNPDTGLVCGVSGVASAEDVDDIDALAEEVMEKISAEKGVEFNPTDDGDGVLTADLKLVDVVHEEVDAYYFISWDEDALMLGLVVPEYAPDEDGDADDEDEDIDSDDEECVNDLTEDAEERDTPVARPTLIRKMLTSFLGVKFGDSVDQYADDFSKSEAVQDGMEAVPGRVNEFMEFDDCNVLYNPVSRKVCGVLCSVADDDLEDPDEYRNEVVSILEEKYETKAVDRKHVQAFPFAAAGNNQVRHMIIVRHIEGRVILMAWDFGLAAEKARPVRNRKNNLDAL